MRVAVPKETAPGERRVALVPETVSKLREAGFEASVERGAGTSAGFSDDDYAAAGADARRQRVAHDRSRSSRVRRVAFGRRRRVALAGNGRDRVPRAADRLRGHRATSRARGRRLRDGVDPSNHARAVDGRAVVPGNGCRIQGCSPRGRPRAAPLPHAHDGRRHDRAGAGARHRGRRRRPPGDRDCAAPRGARICLRRATGRGRAGAEPRCDLPRSGSPRGGNGRRLRKRAHARAAGASSRLPSKSGFPTSTW